MNPTWQRPGVQLYLGDCLAVLADLPADSFDAIITDAPYGLSFMGKDWDHSVPGIPFWAAILRVAKPGAHMLAFGGTRTWHRLAVAIEDAGWQLRDTLMWLYGSGFPKSLDISKAIDKAAGAERNVLGPNPNGRPNSAGKPVAVWSPRVDGVLSIPATEAAAAWDGWGTALKPAWEPILLCRKPCSEPTVAANVIRHGTGGINVDACRIALEENVGTYSTPGKGGLGKNVFHEGFPSGARPSVAVEGSVRHDARGRFPANLLHDGSPEVLEGFPAAEPARTGFRGEEHSGRHGGLADLGGNIREGTDSLRGHNDNGGSAARFFYCAKASKADRDEGCEGMERRPGGSTVAGYTDDVANGLDRNRPVHNFHPTVKPCALMRYLSRLITPPGGVVLDPFMGSGSTGKAAIAEGFRFAGIEIDPAYLAIATARIRHALRQPPLPFESARDAARQAIATEAAE